MILTIESEYGSEKVAQAVLKALAPDNEGYVESRIDGSTLHFTLRADTVGTLKNGADDLLACLRIAEESAGLVLSAGALSDPDGDSL